MKGLLISILIIFSMNCFSQMTMNARHFTTIRDTATPPPSGFSTEYQAVYDEFTNKPDATNAAYQDTLAIMLNDSSLWNITAGLVVFAQESNAGNEALYNWRYPTGTSATAVSSPTFTSNLGFTGDGAADYITLNWNPTDDDAGGVVSQNDAAIVAYVHTNASNDFAMGSNNGTTRTFLQPAVGGVYYGGINNASNDTETDATAVGVLGLTRLASNLFKFAINGVNSADQYQTSNGEVDIDYYVLGYNGSGTPGGFSTATVSIVWWGGGLDATESRALNNILEHYMDNLGYGVQ